MTGLEVEESPADCELTLVDDWNNDILIQFFTFSPCLLSSPGLNHYFRFRLLIFK